MKLKGIVPYKPSVSIMDMLNFQADAPETHTRSPFVNAFLAAFYATEADAKDIAKAMGVTLVQLSSILQVETGMKFSEFHDYWMVYKVNVAVALHPNCSSDELAHHAGFSGRSALWTFVNSPRYKRIAEEMGAIHFPKPRKQASHRW